MVRTKIGLVLAAALVFFCLVYAHVEHGLNGPWYWNWKYRYPPLPAARVYLPMLLAVLPVLGAQLLDRRRRGLRTVALLALMLGCLGLKLAAVLFRTDPPSLDFVVAVVEQSQMTSYYTDAVSVKDQPLRQWVSEYPKSMSQFNLHTRSKPPGPMLYWWMMIRLLGDSAPRIGGVLLGLLATLSIPATYWMLRTMLADESAAFAGASVMSLCPGFVLFFPMMDPVYPILGAAMMGTWWLALRNDRAMAAIGLGLTLSATLLITFSTLVLGAFMVGLIVVTRARPAVVARQAAIAMGTMLLGSGLLWLIIGYNPIATFLSAWRHQHELLDMYAAQRPYPTTILFDLTDFALGVGWIGIVMAICYFIAPREQLQNARLAMLALAQIVLVAVTGLIQSETSRVWCFMLPLLMIPVGMELSRWPLKARIAGLAAMVLLTAVIHQNMGFLY